MVVFNCAKKSLENAEPQDAEKSNKQVLVKPGPPGRSASDRRCALMAKTPIFCENSDRYSKMKTVEKWRAIWVVSK